jgi:ubiquinone/menaquinone biosynthesis C-methylase UbiE
MSDHKATVREQYGAHADAYVTSEVHAKGASLERLVELTRPQPEWTVLDVSTGGGHTALAFAPHVRKVVATDLTPEMLTAAERFARERGVTNIGYQVADAESLPFGDGEFDLVTNRIALHHYPDARKAMAEMTRVLKTGGLLALVDNVVPPEKQIAGYINAYEKLRDPSHHWCYPVVRLEAYLAEAGLRVEHVETADKEMEFEPWAERMGASAEKKEKLRALLAQAPEGASAFFKPRGEGAQLTFSLEEAILIARK